MEILIIVVAIVLGFIFLLKPAEQKIIINEIENNSYNIENEPLSFMSNLMYVSYKDFAKKNKVAIMEEDERRISFYYILKNGIKIQITAKDEKFFGNEYAK
ncbi:MAG: hypothetical protein QG567_1936, partial [Campylobacterota bacterium]|nr:hypothetical protein [Campylobacterota bacterium]